MSKGSWTALLESAVDVDGLRVDFPRRTAYRGEATFTLTQMEAECFAFLLSKAPHPVSREDLFREVWRASPTMQSRAADNIVRKLRAKVEPSREDPTLIVSAYGSGYACTAQPTILPRLHAPPSAPVATEEPPPPARTRSNLGTATSSFLGREADLERLLGIVLGGARLLTLFGPPGMGKTRTGHRLCSELAEKCHFSGGVLLVDLVSAQTETDVVYGAALALGAEQGRTSADTVLQIGQHLATRGPMLVWFDNFEQVADAAASTLDVWLRAAPEAQFVVGSRERLRLEGEVAMELLPLESAPAEALFLERARSAGCERAMDPREVAEIVGILEGIPLAIELAASWVPILSLEGLRQRLARRLEILGGNRRGGNPRHRSLQAALDSSWVLLAPWEQAALAQCAVFRGGFMVEAAEAVVELPKDAPPVLAVLASLRDKSVLRTNQGGDSRLGFYATIQEYAADKLEQGADRVEVERRFAAYWNSFSAEMESRIRQRDDREARVAVRAELDNLCEAFRCAAAGGAIDEALRVAHLFGITAVRAWPRRQVLEILDRAASIAQESRPEELPQILAERANRFLGWGDYAGVESALSGVQVEEGRLSLAGATLLYTQGDVLLYREAPPEQVVPLFSRAAQGFEALGDQRGRLQALERYGRCLLEAGLLAEWRHLSLELEALSESLNQSWMLANVLKTRAGVAINEGYPAEAKALLERIQDLLELEADRRVMERLTGNLLAGILAEEADYETAHVVCRAQVARQQELAAGNTRTRWLVEALFWLGIIELLRGQMEPAERALETIAQADSAQEGLRASAQAILGLLLSRAGRSAEAQQRFLQAREGAANVRWPATRPLIDLCSGVPVPLPTDGTPEFGWEVRMIRRFLAQSS